MAVIEKPQKVGRKMKVAVLGAAYDTNNLGVSALTTGTLKCILHQYPDAEIILLNYGKTGFTFPFRTANKEVMVRFVNLRFSKRFFLPNNIGALLMLAMLMKIAPSRRLRQRLIDRNPWLKEIVGCDLIASMAGGDSFSDIYGMGRMLYTCLPQLLAALLGKRLILLPQTIGPFKGRIARTIARYILRHAELIYSRDDQGVHDAKSLMGDDQKSDKVRFCYDVGFVVDPEPPSDLGSRGLPVRSKNGQLLVGLNISGLLFMGGLNRRNQFGLKVEYDQFMYRLIDFLIQKRSAAVLLVPHVFGNAGESDTPVCQKVYDALKSKYVHSIAVLCSDCRLEEVKYVIGLCDFFIGARMHSCIAAVSQNVPAVPMAYSDKFVGVMQTIGIESNVVDLRKMCEEEILALIDRAMDRRAEVGQQLAKTMPQVKETVLRLFEDMEFGGPSLCSRPTIERVQVGA